ncbi:hypothetical protein VCHA35O141_60165 [Vibrio chagasii]|nr:hypothetical protein VCHA38P215_110021 [Vibrio chagasii]CAH6932279.1 hypothetical protein VCHA48P434_110167 [Vibrio chagasii]CAH7038776.1 hypothetical protein VCHA31O73_60039 [Vibrio chagasii]CAH7061267.1 hypothetical protein VCHA35O141_60165 [Vibrio chagasii]CAH7088699.1 hypothetical protein VCHA35O143_70166 [Vibrio chagasii]
MPEGCHIEQRDLTHDNSEPTTTSPTAPVAKTIVLTTTLASASAQANAHAANTIQQPNTDQSDNHQEASRSNTESAPLVYIIPHKEHKTGLSLKNTTLEREHLAHTEEERKPKPNRGRSHQ